MKYYDKNKKWYYLIYLDAKKYVWMGNVSKLLVDGF